MRHSWSKDDPSKGLSTCSNCKLEVKTYKIKKGGLARCEPKKPEIPPKTDCPRHKEAATAGALICWNCGATYTPEELKAGRLRMQRNIRWQRRKRAKDLDNIKNPPV